MELYIDINITKIIIGTFLFEPIGLKNAKLLRIANANFTDGNLFCWPKDFCLMLWKPFEIGFLR